MGIESQGRFYEIKIVNNMVLTEACLQVPQYNFFSLNSIFNFANSNFEVGNNFKVGIQKSFLKLEIPITHHHKLADLRSFIIK